MEGLEGNRQPSNTASKRAALLAEHLARAALAPCLAGTGRERSHPSAGANPRAARCERARPRRREMRSNYAPAMMPSPLLHEVKIKRCLYHTGAFAASRSWSGLAGGGATLTPSL